ncbi:hypothetical protein AQ490_06510 [Wenjunlia vitaminophila]|uniref:Uncharacterized protein n=1 Tax=Wenjunlia vitaminophila TaxID=76728 RepID=A0A0T6LNI7_WENVI|nr:hypothetical protein [Wenjunlia vitaminophila]KRV47544.1 hypothetical protein AQ490_06510 [Wenjunlia vitaminophila]
MLLSFSAVALFGFLTAVLLKVRAHAAALPTTFLFGFFLADTGAAPVIRQLLADTAKALNSLG